MLNNYFGTVMTDEPDGMLPDFDRVNGYDPIDNLHITENEVLEIMLKIKVNKSAGPDEIHPKVLREAVSLSKPLTMLFNHSLETGTLPRD